MNFGVDFLKTRGGDTTKIEAFERSRRDLSFHRHVARRLHSPVVEKTIFESHLRACVVLLLQQLFVVQYWYGYAANSLCVLKFALALLLMVQAVCDKLTWSRSSASTSSMMDAYLMRQKTSLYGDR